MPFFLWLFLCCSSIGKGQEITELITADTRAANIPFSETHSTASIAKFILANYETEKERLRAIYSWVTYNIKYDSDSMYVINSGKDPETRITAALRRRKGVCENFAAIFNDIAVKCGIRSYEVPGYCKQSGIVDRTAHTWCAVHLDSLWLFCDPTWDIGFSGNSKYFLVPPTLFIETHMPFDPLWQLLDHTVSHKEFYQGYMRYNKDKPAMSYPDSLNTYIDMSELEQLESAASRISQAGIANELVRTRLAWLQMQISIIYQEKDMNNYNSAVSDLNKINAIFNDFVQYRNSRFLPKKPDSELRSMLVPIDGLLSAANKKLDELDGSPVNFQYDTGLLRNRLIAISNRMEEQKAFLKRYFASAQSDREKLFYQ
ncbi:MAG: transglutaminase domain-containing protein [Ferruginibacter sp.]